MYACWLKLKQNHFNFTATVIFTATILAWTKLNNAAHCQTGWVGWNKMCYKLTGTKNDWNHSQSNCLKDGGSLASIESKEENLFVLSLLNSLSSSIKVWIGLNDIENEGQLKWVDGNFLDFTNLSDPSQNQEDKDCGTFINTQQQVRWLMQSCDNWFGFLCKYVPPSIKEDFSLQENYTRQQLYNSVQNSVLLNHVLKKKTVPSLLHCTSLCLKETKCMSFNYKAPQDSQIQKGLCLLNSATAEEFPEDFVYNSAFIYALPIK